jgi:hypothetical protein
MRQKKGKASLATRPLRETDPLRKPISCPDTKSPNEGQTHDDAWPYIDRHGHPHSAGILENWSEAARRALGVRRVEPEGDAP